MAKVQHTCTGCVPIDASIIEAYVALVNTNEGAKAAEALRVVAEESRVDAEEDRVEAEAARVDEEAARVSAEDARVVAENARAAAEDLREGAEDDRAAVETARETAEAARVAAEAMRVSAEESRESAEAARAAQASADHTVAAGDHTQAAADHTTAEADHTTAGSDHTRAGEDHTLAAADHVTAEADHATWAGYRVVVKSVGETAPASPSSGDKWYKTTDNKIYSYDGSSWDSGVAATTGATIVNSATNDVYVFNGASLFNNEAELSQLEAKVDDLSTGKYYGYFAQEEDLPEADVDGFAYVGEGPTYTIYNLRGGVWTSSNITVNQSPIGNDEDIDQNEDGKLQFANRVYNAQQPNGMGYKILRKDATFASQVTEANTIYEIRYDFDLNNASVTIPAGCVLKFNGGSVSNGELNMSRGEISAVDDNILRGTTLSNIKDNTIYADWFISGGIVSQSLLEYFAQTAGTIIWGNRDYTLSDVGGISLEDGTKFIGNGGDQSHFILTPASGASYVFRYYDNCAFKNIFFDVQVNRTCDILRFDTSRYNNIKGKDPWITLRGLTIYAPYVSQSHTNYAVTALRFLVRNFNDDNSNNGNKYNIISRRCDICDIHTSHVHSVILEVTQNTLASGQSMVYANSIAFEKFSIVSNRGFSFIRTNNAGTAMTASGGIEIKDCFIQLEVNSISDDVKAVKIKGLTATLSNFTAWDCQEPFLIDDSKITIVSGFIPSAKTSEGSRYMGAKCINGGSINYLYSPSKINMPLTDYDPNTGSGVFVIEPSQDEVTVKFDGRDVNPKMRQSLTNTGFERKVIGNNNYYYFDEKVERGSNGYLKEIYDANTDRHYVIENYKYINENIFPFYNRTFLVKYSFASVMVIANSCADYQFTLNYADTPPTLNLLGAFVVAGNNRAMVIRASISGNVVTLTIDTTEWGGEYYSFDVILILRATGYTQFEYPTSVTGEQVNGSIKRRQGTGDYRPTGVPIGFTYFDTALGKMIVWNGTAWVNMDGTALS